ncbi:MAG: hypothetical protein HY303_19460 [Candidatus Wallbacteria bacterium]|nr:hypothetical protein [Candidatus Wallbacteria bacterium]
MNKWIPTAFDLFGVDHSSSAHWFYVWGLKGRFDEPTAAPDPDKSKLNEHNRNLYRQECLELVEQFNRMLPPESPKLTVPDMKFNRRIGQHANQCFTVDGQPIEPAAYEAYVKLVLPVDEDRTRLEPIFADPDWIAEKQGATPLP